MLRSRTTYYLGLSIKHVVVPRQGLLSLNTNTMRTLGPFVSHKQQEEPLLIGKVHIFMKFIAINWIFFVLLTITALFVTNYKFANAYKAIYPIKMKSLPLAWAGHQSCYGHGIRLSTHQFHFHRYGLWTSFNGPCIFIIINLGACVKWLLG